MKDLQKRQKYLITFTVGYDQRYNIDAAVKKVSTLDVTDVIGLLDVDDDLFRGLPRSSVTISLSCCSITTAGLVNGTSLSGPGTLFMSVSGNRLNGQNRAALSSPVDHQ